MIDTNQLISVAFTLITNFTNVVPIPPEHVPHNREDLVKVVVGSPYSPLDLYLVCKSGDEFWIRDGIVHQYESPDSYYLLQNLKVLPRLAGSAKITSEQATAQATEMLKRLSKTGKPIDGLVPKVKASQAKDVHFYHVSWPTPDSAFEAGIGAVEIDGRNGRVVFIQLWAPEFYDTAFAQEIRDRVYKPDQVPKRPSLSNPAASLPKPLTNEVELLISDWLKFCKGLELQPGGETNVGNVDWTETFTSTNAGVMGTGRFCKVQFRNGTIFESLNGKVFAHFSGDAAFVGPWAEKSSDQWKDYLGEPNRKWEDLAKELNFLLVHRLGLSYSQVGKFTPTLYVRGRGGVARCVVRWCETENLAKLPPDKLKTALYVEFDLGSGQIKSLRIDEPEFLKWKE